MNLLSCRTFNCFNVLVLILVLGSFLSNWYWPLFIWPIHFSKYSSWLRITVDLPFSAGKITVDVSDCNSFKALHSSLDRLSLGGLEFWSERLTLAWIVSASSFSRSFTTSPLVAMIWLLGSVLEVIEKLRPFQEDRFWYGLIVQKTY